MTGLTDDQLIAQATQAARNSPDFQRRKRAVGLTEQQHAARALAIGGSDAAAAVGLSRYKTPVRLWQEKLGLVQREAYRETEAVHFGRVLEQIVADEFCRRKGVQVRRVNQTSISKSHPFMVGHVDRRIAKAKAGLECKAAGWRMIKEWGEDGTDNIPIEYYIQCLHYLAIFGFDIWYCAVLLAGADYRIYEVQRDQSVINDLVEREEYFKLCLDTRTPPELKTLADAFALYPRDNGGDITATIEVQQLLEAFKNGKKEIKALKERLDGEQLALQAFMGPASVLVDTNGKQLASWKTQSQRQFIHLADGIDGMLNVFNMRVLRTGK